MSEKKKAAADTAVLSKVRKEEPPVTFSKEEITAVLDRLKEQFPDAGCELVFADHFQLLAAVVLSAQTTDKSVNRVTPALFQQYPDAFAMARAGETEAEMMGLDPSSLTEEARFELGTRAVSEIIRSIGMYHNKAKNLIRLSAALVSQYAGPGRLRSINRASRRRPENRECRSVRWVRTPAHRGGYPCVPCRLPHRIRPGKGCPLDRKSVDDALPGRPLVRGAPLSSVPRTLLLHRTQTGLRTLPNHAVLPGVSGKRSRERMIPAG